MNKLPFYDNFHLFFYECGKVLMKELFLMDNSVSMNELHFDF